MLDNAVNMLTQGVTFLGGVLVVFGLINLGMTIKKYSNRQIKNYRWR